MTRRRWSWVLVAALAVLAMPGAHVGAQAGDYTIALTVYACPAGMTVETLATDECAVITEGFDVRIISLSGVMPPLMLSEATLDGDRFIWESGLIGDRGAIGPLAIEETQLPDGYDDYLVTGGGATLGQLGDWTFTVNSGNAAPDLQIYNVATEGDGAQPESTPPPDEPAIGAAIESGACDALDSVTSAPLEAPALPDGEREGAAGAVPAGFSYSIVDEPLDDLLAEEHAVTVRGAEGEVLACGELGGARAADGAFAVGLGAVDGSGVFGIAYLAPMPDDAEQTQISLFVAGLEAR